jgi:hypothetical protein
MQLTLTLSSFARHAVVHAHTAYPSCCLCQLVSFAMSSVCADVDVAHLRYTARSLDALPSVTAGTVVVACSCLGYLALDVGLGGHFACGFCHWATDVPCAYCDDCE